MPLFLWAITSLLVSARAENSPTSSSFLPTEKPFENLDAYMVPTEPSLTLMDVMSKVEHLDKMYNNSCSMDIMVFVSALMSWKPPTWALTMLDSFGKPGSALLQGNGQWPGSYSQCRSVVQESAVIGRPFRGKFCWAFFAVKPGYREMFIPETYKDLFVKSAICVPDSCTNIQLLHAAKLLTDWHPIPYFSSILNLTEIACLPHPILWESKADVSVLLLVCIFVMLVIAGTAYDLYQGDRTLKNEDDTLPTNDKPRKGSILLIFSAYSNGKKLFALSGGKQCLPAVNGIRVISMLWIISGHCSLVNILTMDNLKTFYDESRSFPIATIFQGVLAVDSFFFLSGLLVAHAYLNEYERSGGRISWVKFYVHRYWRLTPTYLLIVLVFFAGLGKYMGQGPFWVRPFTESGICRKTWWANALYINNFMPDDAQCMSHSWYLANDMQFYLISPLLLIPFTRSVRWSLFTALLVLAGTCSISGILGSSYNFPISPDFRDAPPGSEAYNEAFRVLYSKPYARIGPYIIGLLTGWLIQRTSAITMPKAAVAFGWIFSLTTIVTIVRIVEDVDSMSAATKVLYHTFAREAWATAIAWVIVACASGYGGVVNSFLSWSGWNPLSRLTYCTFLWHPAAIFLTMGTTEVTIHYTSLFLALMITVNAVCGFGGAAVLSLLFEAPFVGLENLVLRGKNNYKRLSRQAERNV